MSGGIYEFDGQELYGDGREVEPMSETKPASADAAFERWWNDPENDDHCTSAGFYSGYFAGRKDSAIHELAQLAQRVRNGTYDRDDARDEIARAIESRVRELEAG